MWQLKFYHKTVLRLVSAFLLLVIFTISITPKRYLHDAFANHEDTATPVSQGGEDVLSAKGFDCDCDSLVATSPFTEQEDALKLFISTNYYLANAFFIPRFFSTYHAYFELRGPPVFA